jgi:hypothetical protein
VTPRYLLSLPERVVRSLSAVTAGLLRETADVALPAAFRRTRLYRSLVETTLRFLIEQVGQVEGAYAPGSGQLAEDFVLRKAAGNGIEVLGLLTFSASPVWVLAALADFSGAGKDLVSAIADSLSEAGLLERGRRFESVEQLLAGLESTTGRAADAVNVPPIDVAGLRREWEAIRAEASQLQLPAIEQVSESWRKLQEQSAAQNRSVFEVSTLLALSAISRLPKAAHLLADKTGGRLARGLLSHYSQAIREIAERGFVAHWQAEFRPYLRAAAQQFSPVKKSSTERLLD